MFWCRKCFSFLTLQLWLKLHQSNSLLNETYFYSYQVLIFYRFYSAIDSYLKRFTQRYLQIQDRLQFKTRSFKATKTNPSHYLPGNDKLQILQQQFIFFKTLILDLNSMSDWLCLTESGSLFHTKHARNRIEFVP